MKSFSGLHTLAFIFLLGNSWVASTYIHTNEVVEKHDDSNLDLATCSPDSVCGYLQANANGINMQRRCGCPMGYKCPMTWDTVDGHSVTQGSDQYKFCGMAPTLKQCQNGVTAYTTRVVFAKDTDEVLVQSDKIHCICPEGSNHVLSNQKENSDDVSEVMELSYTCAPLDICQVGEYCKAVSVTPREFLVQRRCVCPDGLRCPTNTSNGVKTTPMGNGLVHFIRCQR